MEIEAVDFFYLSMPTVLDIADGSQDVLLVRLRAGDHEGWGECEASPLVSIASLVAPMSHSACKPVQASVLGQRISSPSDIARIGRDVRYNSFDQLQSAHTFSGIDIALWDLLGKMLEEPVYRLLGAERAHPKRPYASSLFGSTPEETHAIAVGLAAQGYTAVKFGWQGFGLSDVRSDALQLEAAREGLGADIALLVDAGMAWGNDAEAAIARVPALLQHSVAFLEEPFVPGSDRAYRALKAAGGGLRLAGGEGSHSVESAIAMLDHASVDIIQIDTGRVGGISSARAVAQEAKRRGRTFVNHTFTSHLALSASLQPYLDDAESELCEYPVDAKPVSFDLTHTHLLRDENGLISAPESPGLGIEVRGDTIERYVRDIEIRVDGDLVYSTPPVPAGG